jgi:hypothetical protein
LLPFLFAWNGLQRCLLICFLIAEMKKILSAGFIWKGDSDLLGGFAWIVGFLGNNRRHRGRMSSAYTLFWFPFEAELICAYAVVSDSFFVRTYFFPFRAACGVAKRG